MTDRAGRKTGSADRAGRILGRRMARVLTDDELQKINSGLEDLHQQTVTLIVPSDCD